MGTHIGIVAELAAILLTSFTLVGRACLSSCVCESLLVCLDILIKNVNLYSDSCHLCGHTDTFID